MSSIDHVRMAAGGVVRVGLQPGQSPGASIVIRLFIPLRNGEDSVGELLNYAHLANAAAGIAVGAGVVAGPVAVRAHTVVHVRLVCPTREIRRAPNGLRNDAQNSVWSHPR